jgi:hypothetical protein
LPTILYLNNPLGQVLTKKEAIDAVTAPGYGLESLVNEKINVRVFGDVAVATALGIGTGRHGRQEVIGRFRYLRVWVSRPAVIHQAVADVPDDDPVAEADIIRRAGAAPVFLGRYSPAV